MNCVVHSNATDDGHDILMISVFSHLAVNRVLGKLPLLIHDKMITVEKHFPAPAEADQVHQFDPKRREKCIVKVTGLPADISKEHITLYFESTKRSGGGEVKDMQFRKNGSVLITFIQKEGKFLTLIHFCTTLLCNLKYKNDKLFTCYHVVYVCN